VFLADVGWSWEYNPFLGTHELAGLKILVMLLSNWDDKDIRDAEKRGSNTAIYREDGRYVFFVNDWGGALGNWGHGPTNLMRHFTHSRWECDDYARQSLRFVRMHDGQFRWGYQGSRMKAMMDGLTSDDVRWFMRYLGRLTNAQIHAGLAASGATPAEISCYTKALKLRIGQLAALAQAHAPESRAARVPQLLATRRN
jgi:hypothetical protein